MTKTKRFVLSIVCVLIVVLTLVIARPVYVKEGSDTAQVLAENFMSKKAYSLQDYEITEAELDEEYVRIHYAVQPKPGRHYSNWNAGNGHEGEDGWLVEKSAFIWYFNIGNLYITGINANTGW